MFIKLIDRTWSLLANLGGVVTSIGLLVFTSKYIWNFSTNLFQEKPVWAIVLLLFLAISFIFLLSLLRERVLDFFRRLRKESIIEQLEAAEDSSASNFDIVEHLPEQKLFEGVEELSEDEAKKWAQDASMESFNFYLTYRGGGVSIRIQIFFYSKWKKEYLVLYYPRLSRDMEKEESELSEKEIPFYRVPLWREATIQAFLKVKHKLPKDFELIINSHTGQEAYIWFEYREGEVKSKINFDFKDNILRCKEDSAEINVNTARQKNRTKTGQPTEDLK